jgi:hypothetical protein
VLTPALVTMAAAQHRAAPPLAGFEQLQEQMGQIINSFLRGGQNLGGASQAPFWVPAADLEETDDASQRSSSSENR